MKLAKWRPPIAILLISDSGVVNFWDKRTKSLAIHHLSAAIGESFHWNSTKQGMSHVSSSPLELQSPAIKGNGHLHRPPLEAFRIISKMTQSNRAKHKLW